jgi:hypothetical protein
MDMRVDAPLNRYIKAVRRLHTASMESEPHFRDRSNPASVIPGSVSHYGPTACY